MKLFLVDAKVKKSLYPDRVENFNDNRLVWADSWEDALLKYQRYWDDKRDPYSVAYIVMKATANEAIA